MIPSTNHNCFYNNNMLQSSTPISGKISFSSTEAPSTSSFQMNDQQRKDKIMDIIDEVLDILDDDCGNYDITIPGL